MFQLDIIFDVVCMAGHLVTLHMVMFIVFVFSLLLEIKFVRSCRA